MIELTDAERTKLLVWVTTCQIQYHIDRTLNNPFIGLGSAQEQYRAELVGYVNELLSARAATPQQAAEPVAWRAEMVERIRQAHDLSLDGEHRERRIALLGIANALAAPHSEPEPAPEKFTAVERAWFAAKFPIPDGMVYWDEDKYSVHRAYENSYRADRYCAQWQAWQARASISHALALVAGWQPIETAPTTGRTLLLGYFNSHGNWRTMRGQWMSQDYIDRNFEDPEGFEAGWFETVVEADDQPNCWATEPTHWMPLPKPPAPTKDTK